MHKRGQNPLCSISHTGTSCVVNYVDCENDLYSVESRLNTRKRATLYSRRTYTNVY